ncbi:hypothetical protein ACXU4B_14540 [Dyella soli]|uniref:Uncharacterized protein n=1 Tax=Dyella soli TaxID=522319 RepID=A0A4R0YRJ8_9GAMM|nr:hypothetical protein [Dyella soli]TCI09135.1 hypothetical protein EZM97_23135 [Dyella soli]
MTTFRFHPKWNGGLYCTGPGGCLELELPMVILTAYLPTEEAWKSEAPDWARDKWSVIRRELEAWCHENKVNFMIDAVARIY